MIEMEHVTKRYGTYAALDDLSLRIEQGQIYGFLGPNGAGKSTAMNLLTGYLTPTEGRIRIDGIDLMREPEKAKRCVGYLPELPPLYQDMTVEEYLSFAAQLKRIPRKGRRGQTDQVMELTRTKAVRKQLIRHLSKGYKQRVGLAQAILGEPKVIILDEPTVGLDPKQIMEMRDFIRALKKKHTVLLSSHILSEVSAVCDHILILAEGRLVASGTPQELQLCMGGGRQLALRVKGSREALERTLDRLDGVREYHVLLQQEVEEGVAEAQILTKPGQEIREALFYHLAEAKLPILQLQLHEKSLEDIFLQLTDDTLQQETNKEEETEYDSNL